MATSSQPLVIDLIVQKIQGLVTAGAFSPLTVDVVDGPETPNDPDVLVAVMGWPGGGQTGARLEWAHLGNSSRYERYEILVAVSAFAGGSADANQYGTSDAQLTARTNAGIVEAAIETAMLQDRNLSVQNGGAQACIWCLLQDASYSQEAPPDVDGVLGRYANWMLKFGVYNLLGGA